MDITALGQSGPIGELGLRGRSSCGLGSPAFNDLVRQAKTLDEVGLAAIVALPFPNTSFLVFETAMFSHG